MLHLQGMHPPRTLSYAYAKGPNGVRGGLAFPYGRGTSVNRVAMFSDVHRNVTKRGWKLQSLFLCAMLGELKSEGPKGSE